MKGKSIKYEFKATIWKYDGPAGWHFVSLPEQMGREIREHLHWQEEGWGRLKVTAKIGNSTWETAIWFDTKKKTYLLPFKAEIRRREFIHAGDTVKVMIWI